MEVIDLTHYIGATVDAATWAALQAESTRRYGQAWEWVVYETARGVHITRLIVRPEVSFRSVAAASADSGATPPATLHSAQDETNQSTKTNGENNMANVAELAQTPWLKAEDLQGSTRTVQIAGASVEMMKNMDGQDEQKVVVSFSGKKKKLIANRSQLKSLIAALGDETDRWWGQQIMLSPTIGSNGKPTIQVLPVPRSEGEDSENPF